MLADERTAKAAFEIIAGEADRYLAEASSALEYIWSIRPDLSRGHTLISDGLFADAMHKLINAFGQLALNVFDDGPRRTSESSLTYSIRLARLAAIKSQFDGIDLGVFRDRSIRNRYTHFDESVAKLVSKHPRANVVRNLGLSHRRMISNPNGIVYLWTYVFDEDRVLHLGAEFDARRMYETLLLVLARAKEG